MEALQTGRQGVAEQKVTPALSAAALGSGDLPVLGTPALLALMEAAAVDAVAACLDAASTSVGIFAELHHLAATPLGSVVRTEATLTQIEGRTLTFEIVAHDGRERIGTALHRRMIVNRQRFMQRVEGKR